MLDPNITILEHEQEWKCPSTGITYYRTIQIERTIDPDYGADADGNRGERRAFYELTATSAWLDKDGFDPPTNFTEDDDIDFQEKVPTPEQVCDRVAETDEW